MDWSKSKRSSFSVGSFKPNNFNDYERYSNVQTSPQHSILSPALHAQQQQLPVRSAYYETHWPLFASDWSRHDSAGTETVAISSYREDAINKIEILDGSSSVVEHANGNTTEGVNFTKISETNVQLPVTNLQWDPSGSEKLITTNDRLKLWEIDFNNQLVERLNLINGVQHNHNGHSGTTNKPQSLPPLTSFDWNKVKPNIVITSSIDTTCTVWDLVYPSSPKTQLIAHDSEVFDVEFIKNSAEIFASVGNDGSMRVFDLRSLEHSTIIYEPPSSAASTTNSSISTSSSTTLGSSPTSSASTALLRLSTSNVDPNVIATFSAKSDQIIILDMRYPGIPTSILSGHTGNINAIEWHPTQPKLLSGGDDCQALIWDFSTSKQSHPQQQHQQHTSTNNNSSNNNTKSSPNSNVIEYPDFAYNDILEINNVTWNTTGDWIGVTSGKGFQGVKM